MIIIISLTTQSVSHLVLCKLSPIMPIFGLRLKLWENVSVGIMDLWLLSLLVGWQGLYIRLPPQAGNQSTYYRYRYQYALSESQ